jgi:hypothetical protein
MVEKKDIRIIKLLSIFAFSMMILALIIILRTPSTPNYEINIYNTYPWYFWMFIMLSIYAGALILIKSYITKAQNNYWIFGFAVILLSNFILLNIPVFQNYLILGRGDILTHIGWMRNIVDTGYFGNDMYPITHILGAVTHYFSGISLESITTLIYPVFSIFYILSFYILYNEILLDKSKVILALVFTSIMVFGTAQTSFAPFTLSFFTIPIFFYLYFRERSNQKWNVKILLIIATIFLLLFHPLTALLLLFSIMIIEFSRYIYLKINQPPQSSSQNVQPIKYRRNFSYVLIALLIAGLLLWKPYLHLLQNGFYTFYLFIESQSSPNFSSALATANKASLNDLITTTMYIYGVLIITILASLISIYELVENNIKSLKNSSLHLLNIFLSLKVYEIFSIIGFLVFVILSIFVYFKLPLFGFTRILSFATIFTSFLMFSLFYIILESKNRKLNINKYVKVLVISIIIFPIICISTLNLYDSPLTLTPNEQVTSSEVNGMETFYLYDNNSSRILDLGISQYRFLAYIYGEQADSYGQDIHIANLSNTSRTNPIDHFGFNNTTTITQFYNGSVYLLINDIAVENYPQIYPNYPNKWRFTPQDFNTLNNTQQVMLIYNNGNLRIYKSD